MSSTGPHLLLYDGPCGLCNRVVQSVLKHDHKAIFYFAPLQSSLAEKFGVDPAQLQDTVIVITNYRSAHPQKFTKSRAALFVLSSLGWPWKIAAILRLIPSRLLDAAYNLIARNRHHFFKPSEICALPPPGHQHRFPEKFGVR